MNGAQDLGGLHGFGPVEPEADEPPFHAQWERRSFALTVAMGFTGQWNIDISRHSRESLPPAQYLTKTYYDIWEAGLEKLLAMRGLATEEEIAHGKSTAAPAPLARILMAADVQKMLARGGPADRETNTDPALTIGDHVRARVMNPSGHTRLPRYARGRAGIVAAVRGCHVFPDSNAHDGGENPQWLYSVEFAAAELWGPQGPADDTVRIDLWEPYLERL